MPAAATLDPTARLLVTGASGQLGQLVLTHLLDTLHVSPDRIVAASRSTDKLQAWADRGVTTRRLDFTDAASVEAAAQGVDRALLISGDDLAHRLEGHKTAVAALVKAGVKHILYTSLLNADNATALVKHDHLATEQYIKESKVSSYTFLRNGLYFENDIGSIKGAKHSGQWFSAARDGRNAAISRSDLALANATALAADDYDNRVYELSGSVGLTIDQVVANVAKAIGKSIQVIQVDAEQLAQGIAHATGWPVEVTRVLASFDTSTAEGHADVVANDFVKLTGREPQTHEAWLEANKPLLQAL